IHLVKKAVVKGFISIADVCETFGSGVIQTFSKSMFYLKSTCPFTLTRFTLSGVTCSITVQRNATGLMNSVEITVNKITTVLQDGKITVEGSSISLPFDHTYQLVYQYGVFIKLRSKVLPFSAIWRSQPGGISMVHLGTSTEQDDTSDATFL
uniref:VWFD domain-containing protein n=1 Tax=Astyanax mexicanus TaxID=7994 RepID=A0A3B1IIV6_ASTMX